MKKIILAFGIWLLANSLLLWRGAGGEAFAQQDAQYSQYMFNRLALNPAYAGSREVLATSLLYRDQWTAIEGAPSTAAFSIQMPLKKKKIGLGAEIISDRIGPKNTTALLASYAYRIPLAKGKLAFGLRMGIYDYVIDLKSEYFKDQNDAYLREHSGRSSKFTGTGDFGMYYYSRTFYCGLSATHLNRGKIVETTSDSARQALHYFIPLGKSFEAGNVIINPSILIKGATNSPSAVDVGCNLLLKEKLWLGLSLRSSYGAVFLAQYQVNEKMKVGYSYDYGANKIGTAGRGSHEIMIGYDLNIHGTKMIMPRYL